MVDSKQVGFWKLIEKYKIEIPIIQRDYAQGRDNSKIEKIRKKFLNDLILAIEKNQPLELDFVYGIVESGTLKPLDGQQRLTTLYLLHWYISWKTGKLLEIKEVREILLKFTYETRISSREFCNNLISNSSNLGEGISISKKIEDSRWFFLSWKKDPTIKAMLFMLDYIENLLKYKIDHLQDFWRTLTAENPPITFNFKELGEIGLTDDLYIKMNARGKALTEFENFKARFEQHIESNKWEEGITIPTKTFAHKIDTVWTDLFWKHRGEDNEVDNEFVKFISSVAINHYAQSSEIYKNEEEEKQLGVNDKNIPDSAIKKYRIEERIKFLINEPLEVIPIDFSTQGSFQYLQDCFEIYSNNQNYDELIPQDLTLWNFCESKKVKINKQHELENNLFIELIKDGNTTYPQRALFYAQTKYLEKTALNTTSFSNWMRVIRNIVQNSTIDSAPTFIGTIGLIKELSNGCQDIYGYLKENKIISGTSSNQVKEEILKASLITAGSENREVVFLTEDTNFFKGRISFALYCINFNKKEDIFNSLLLRSINEVVKEHLAKDDITNDFRRALFTIKDNRFYDYWNTSWLYAVDAPKRCMIENILDLKNYSHNQSFRDYLKEILLILTNNSLFDAVNNYVIPENMPNWKKRIIKEKGLLDFSHKHYFAVDEENSCWLMPQSRVANSKEGVAKCKKIK